MASDSHSFIVAAIARKIRQYGFVVSYLDSNYRDIDIKKFDIPPKIIHHKPDIIGEKENFFCIGEAKTVNDLSAERTRRQIQDFFDIVQSNDNNKLIIGIPLSGKYLLNNLLKRIGLLGHRQIEIIFVPDELLSHEEI